MASDGRPNGYHIGGKQTGSFGDLGAFSFFPSKNLGCYGDGGLVTTNNDQLAEKVRVLRNHGSMQRYHHNVIGYNSRLDELQAVILRVKLKHIDDFNTNRRRVDQTYKKFLAGTGVVLPFEDGIGHHVYHQYCCLHPKRDAIMKALQENNIASAIYYPIPLHLQPVYQYLGYKKGDLPVSEFASEKVLSLPMFPDLTFEEQPREAARRYFAEDP